MAKNMLADRIAGIICMIVGGIAISEAMRLYPMRTGPLIGDHTMPGIVGGLMVLLGLLIFIVKGEVFKAEYPNRKTMRGMLLTLGLLFVYWFLLGILGYTIITLLVSIGLFIVIGNYSIIKSIMYGILVTTVLYLLFIFWLGMPFPTGIFNI
ncbi:tripartite tricarboxylate transporter TctB family protein [Peribacillus cavernae]|uniref:Tripartite tricarboxylate transporter TctB family protein n=1 Tax=Peribacillus cavernae TaxID=1674310 RepID=A0A3S1B2C7_9BACI|nr:tripartite tricarboxylate transporter TctB family protein [Peribacillus cavernae]MDQ0219509.1 putative tricarboxylic transport membrane protein [Peribacillus cavernae]RUQ27075.1 tripartite tricarboxylate transporter TctB family protein [Peribacillus cavernae]